MGAAASARPAGPSDRSIRSLVNLQASASTARTLNLVRVWQRHGHELPYRSAPFFRNPLLNRSFVVKHRLRANERDLFFDARSVATKIILPIDISDLRSGARSFFVGQKGYGDVLEDLMGPSTPAVQMDIELLALLDGLPSLDPFLMRERLKRSGYTPARCFFDITDADTAKMFEFTCREIAPLIGMSFAGGAGGGETAIHEKTAKLAAKVLADASDEEMEPLRVGMGLDRTTFDEGVFCWKGFIYYKWVMNEIVPHIRPITEEIASVTAVGPSNAEDRLTITGCKSRLVKGVVGACETVRLTLKVYDDAYADLTKNGQPLAFRDFLMKAPMLFYDLGERLAALQHVVSFWRFRFPPGMNAQPTVEELADILLDFEASMAFDPVDAV
jgi:hypothetical protein